MTVTKNNTSFSYILTSFFIIIGAIINGVVYLSLDPILIAGFFYITFYTLLCTTKFGGDLERKIFSIVYSVVFLMAGVSAIYANQFNDIVQLKDANNFFELSSLDVNRMSLTELMFITEGSLAVWVWSHVYDFFSFLGFEKIKYIGITFNMSVVSMTSVMALKILKSLYGFDAYRINRLIFLSSSCGLFWLFATIHIRDAFTLFFTTANILIWVRYLTSKNSVSSALTLISYNLIFIPFFYYLRVEFVFLPFLMMVAAFAARWQLLRRFHYKYFPFILILFALLACIFVFLFGEYFVSLIVKNFETYTLASFAGSSSNSLGISFIIDQPLIIRAPLSFLYLFLMPVPFWHGFSLESSYYLFKSFNVVYMYFLLPLFLLSIRELYSNAHLKTPANLFLLYISLGFAFAVSITSLENRHLGNFLFPIIILSTLIDLRDPIKFKSYIFLLILFLTCVVSMHILWFILKFV